VSDRRIPPAWRDDGDLVAAVRAGGRQELEILLDRHYDRVATIARRLLVNRADAEDATQQALIAVARGLPTFDGRSALSTWVHRVAVNACLDELRRRDRRPRPVAPEDLPTSHATGEVDLAISQIDLDAALERLPADFRIAVVLRDVCDLDYDEIATALGVPPGTVRSRISRGRRLLRDLLGNPDAADDVQGSRP